MEYETTGKQEPRSNKSRSAYDGYLLSNRTLSQLGIQNMTGQPSSRRLRSLAVILVVCFPFVPFFSGKVGSYLGLSPRFAAILGSASVVVALWAIALRLVVTRRSRRRNFANERS